MKERETFLATRRAQNGAFTPAPDCQCGHTERTHGTHAFHGHSRCVVEGCECKSFRRKP